MGKMGFGVAMNGEGWWVIKKIPNTYYWELFKGAFETKAEALLELGKIK